MAEHVQYIVVTDTGIPPEHRAGTKNGLRTGLGKQAHSSPIMITHVRPNRLIETGENGEILKAPMSWILVGGFNEEGWKTEDDMWTDIAQAIADYLEVPMLPIRLNITCKMISRADVLQVLKDDAEFWGET